MKKPTSIENITGVIKNQNPPLPTGAVIIVIESNTQPTTAEDISCVIGNQNSPTTVEGSYMDVSSIAHCFVCKSAECKTSKDSTRNTLLSRTVNHIVKHTNKK